MDKVGVKGLAGARGLVKDVGVGIPGVSLAFKVGKVVGA